MTTLETTVHHDRRSAPPRTRAVVVGVDGSPASRSAVAWALVEATAEGRPLRLVRVLGGHRHVLAGRGEGPDDAAWRELHRLAERAARDYPHTEVHREVHVGDPRERLATLANDEHLVVVGRGAGAGRALGRSTPAAVAAHSEVPVVVAPAGWAGIDHVGQPVVVGVDLRHDSQPVLRFALHEAARRRAPLVAVHSMDDGGRVTLDPEVQWLQARRQLEGELRGVEVLLAPARAEYPHVRLDVLHTLVEPAEALRDAARHAQLLVVGRDGRGGRGAGLGSCARKAVTGAGVPVAVVPCSEGLGSRPQERDGSEDL